MYIIRQPAFCRYTDVEDMWRAALDITNGRPALIVAIVPGWMFNGLANVAHIRMGIEVVKPVTCPPDHHWDGTWLTSKPTGDRPFYWTQWMPPMMDEPEGMGTL